eukprot:COSAG02_NODE_74_length_41878_cov_9.737954_25_plen_196_part_00
MVAEKRVGPQGAADGQLRTRVNRLHGNMPKGSRRKRHTAGDGHVSPAPAPAPAPAAAAPADGAAAQDDASASPGQKPQSAPATTAPSPAQQTMGSGDGQQGLRGEHAVTAARARAAAAVPHHTEQVTSLQLAFQNTDGWRTKPMKVDAVGQIFRGELQTGKSSRPGFDLAGYAEVHCDGYDDCTSFTNTVNPRGS